MMPKTLDNVNHADEVLELVHSVMHQVRARMHQELRGTGELTPMEARVLRFFGRHACATLSDLAQHSGRDKAQLARLVKGLRDRGLLDGQNDSGDRRQVRLVLSAEGEALHRRMQRLDAALATEAVAGLDAADAQVLAALLRQVRDNLRR